MIYNKLVRDNIPEIIKADGKDTKIHIATDSEFKLMLLEKLIEEATELYDAYTKDGIIDINEIADIDEVLRKIKLESGFTVKDIEEAIESKRLSRGSFDKQIILEEVEEK